MKFIGLILAILLMASGVFGATLNLKATWTPNTETDMASYKLYRVDGVRTLIGTATHPATQLLFNQTVPDGSQGTMSFILTAVDQTGNESLDSLPALYGYDMLAPARPGGFGVTKQ